MIPETRHADQISVTVPHDAPVIAVFLSDDSDDVTYFVSDQDAVALAAAEIRRAARTSSDGWSDLDADLVETALSRIHHAYPPTHIEVGWSGD